MRIGIAALEWRGMEEDMKKPKKIKTRVVVRDPGRTRRTIARIIKERDERGSKRAK